MSDLLLISVKFYKLRCHNTLWLVIMPICEHAGMSSKWVMTQGKVFLSRPIIISGILTLSCTRNFPVVTPDEIVYFTMIKLGVGLKLLL